MSNREKYEERGREFYRRYYKQLAGATILSFEGVNLSKEDVKLGIGPGFPCFKVKFANGTFGLIEVSRDPEGNGGGFIFGLPSPKMEDYDKKHKLNDYQEVN